MQNELTSPLLEKAVCRLSQLPGIGRKTALRLALYMLRREEKDTVELGQALIDLRTNINYCRVCHNISETELCPICASPVRDSSVICVVESVRDVMSVEATGQFGGLYHVLGALISPVEGISPGMIEIASLEERVKAGGISEVILALGATPDGETTNYYIYRRLSKYPVKITELARGVSIGNEIEYTDELTLGRSIINRIPFDAI